MVEANLSVRTLLVVTLCLANFSEATVRLWLATLYLASFSVATPGLWWATLCLAHFSVATPGLWWVNLFVAMLPAHRDERAGAPVTHRIAPDQGVCTALVEARTHMLP
mmetsp:Transcript_59410/g.109919  ORF Transcript_59410/g.109919 Transcript_59410/m.109919 type:complete len:108 (-) Transcript_59410:1707-2030(-)